MPGDNPWHWSSLAYAYGRAGNRARAEYALDKFGFDDPRFQKLLRRVGLMQ